MLTVQEITAAIETFVTNHKAWTAPLMFLLAFGKSMAFVSLILPFWGILVAVGALRVKLGLGFVPIWVAASAGAALGDWLSYWLGWHYHERIAKMWPLSRYPDLLPNGHVSSRNGAHGRSCSAGSPGHSAPRCRSSPARCRCRR